MTTFCFTRSNDNRFAFECDNWFIGVKQTNNILGNLRDLCDTYQDPIVFKMKECVIELDTFVTLFHHYQQTDRQIGRHKLTMDFCHCRFISSNAPLGTRSNSASIESFVGNLIELTVITPNFRENDAETQQLFLRFVTHNIDYLHTVFLSGWDPILEILHQSPFFDHVSPCRFNVNKEKRQTIHWIQSVLVIMNLVMATIHPHQRALLDVVVGSVVPLLPPDRVPNWFAALSFRDQQMKLQQIWADYMRESGCVVDQDAPLSITSLAPAVAAPLAPVPA